MGRFLTASTAASTSGAPVYIAGKEDLAVGDVCVNFQGLGFYPWKEKVSPYFATEYANSLRGSHVVVDSAACDGTAVAALPNGSFVIAWHNGSSLKVARFSSVGAVIGAVNSTGIIVAAPESVAVAVTADGGFVVAFIANAGYPSFQRFDKDGAMVGATVTVEATGASGIGLAVLASGEFIVTYGKTAGMTYRFGRFSAAGVLQGALTNIESSGGTVRCCCAALPDGQFIIAFSSATNTPKFGRYNGSGALQGATVQVNANPLSDIKVATTSSGGFVVVYAIGGLLFTRYDAAGNIVGAAQTVAASVGVRISVSKCVDRGFVIAYSVGTTNKFSRFDASGVLQGVATDISTGVSAYNLSVSHLADGGFVAVFLDSSSYPKFGRYSATPVSVIGVVTVGAASGSAAQIGTEGTFQTTITFEPTLGFNHQVQGAPGNKGFLVGNTAILKGLSF